MTKRLSKVLALALLLVAVVVLWIGLFAPIQAWRAETLSSYAAAQAELERLTDAQARLTAEANALDAGPSSSLLWSAAQTGEAYALVQSALSRAASQNGVSFRALTPLPVSQRKGIDSAIVRIEFEADLAQLTGFLRDVEYTTPSLPIDRATLRRLVRPNETSTLPVMFVQIDIAAPVQIGDES